VYIPATVITFYAESPADNEVRITEILLSLEKVDIVQGSLFEMCSSAAAMALMELVSLPQHQW
jgi:hypothetical protein